MTVLPHWWRTGCGVPRPACWIFFEADLVLETLEASPMLSPEGAAAIEALPRGGRRSRPGFMGEVSAAGGGGASLDQMTGIVLSDWLRRPVADRNSPFEEVGVLVPLRLETMLRGG